MKQYEVYYTTDARFKHKPKMHIKYHVVKKVGENAHLLF